MTPILMLMAAGVALAMARKGGDRAATGGRAWAWDPERWHGLMGLGPHERRGLVWNPLVNAWSAAAMRAWR